ncbi:MAG: aminotransferase class V-fold PLP-dependent enzyme [Mucilaginibacter sp.]
MTIPAFTASELQQLRADTKGTAHLAHFNNAGSSLPPDVVLDAVVDYLKEEAIYGGYETEAQYHQLLENVYTSVARLVNADKDEIALVENASVAWGIAFNGIDFKAGDEIITSEMEYVTNFIGFLKIQKTRGVKIRIIPNDEQGNFNLAALEDAIGAQTKLIAITHIPSTAGNILPIAAIGKIAQKHGVLYLVDACQSAGQLPLDVKEINCDMLSVTGRKYLRAPRGTGFLFVKKEVQDQLTPTFIDGFTIQWVTEDDYKLKDNARRFELYENSRGLRIGLGKAVDYALHIGVDKIWQRVELLASQMRADLGNIPGITLHDIGGQQSGIVTFSVKGIDATTVKNKLAEKHINVSVGRAVSTLVYMNKNHLDMVVRASVHYYNTEEEIKLMCKVLSEMVG